MTRFRGFQKYAYKRQKPGYYLHDFLNTKNPLELFANRKFILGIVGLAVIIGGLVLGQGPLFHSQQPNPAYHGVEDPYTYLFEDALPGCSLASWNISPQNVFCQSSGTFACTPGSQNCLSLKTVNGTIPAVAISKSPVDISTVSGKELGLNFGYFEPTNPSAGGFDWMIFLTTNNTIPAGTGNTALAAYVPSADRNVALIIEMLQNAGSSTIGTSVSINTNLETASIGDNFGAGCGPNSSCFGNDGSGTVQPGQSHVEVLLNFTGAANTAGNTGIGITNMHGVTNTWTSLTSILPPLSLTPRYFLGFWERKTSAGDAVVDISGTVASPNCFIGASGFGQVQCMSIVNAVPTAVAVTAPPSSIDTGGFFGPIIKALISLGVFILANIISFGNYLGVLMQPVWAFLGSLATIVLNGLSSIIISLLNGLGSLIGDPNLGDQLVSIFTQVGAYITGLFAKINSLVSNLITFLIDSFNFLFDAANGFLTYWIGTVLFGILSVLVTISNIIVTVLKVFQVGFPFVVLADLLWLLSESVDHGTEGGMKWWAPHEILIVQVGKLMFVLVETLSTFIFQTITEIEAGAADIKPEIAGFSP